MTTETIDFFADTFVAITDYDQYRDVYADAKAGDHEARRIITGMHQLVSKKLAAGHDCVGCGSLIAPSDEIGCVFLAFHSDEKMYGSKGMGVLFCAECASQHDGVDGFAEAFKKIAPLDNIVSARGGLA
jgi:hypothetical protein